MKSEFWTPRKKKQIQAKTREKITENHNENWLRQRENWKRKKYTKQTVNREIKRIACACGLQFFLHSFIWSSTHCYFVLIHLSHQIKYVFLSFKLSYAITVCLCVHNISQLVIVFAFVHLYSLYCLSLFFFHFITFDFFFYIISDVK